MKQILLAQARSYVFLAQALKASNLPYNHYLVEAKKCCALLQSNVLLFNKNKEKEIQDCDETTYTMIRFIKGAA